MDQGPPDHKRPRLSTGSTWSAGGAHHGVSLLHPTPSPTGSQLPHHPPPSTQYQQPSPHPFSRPPGPGDPHPQQQQHHHPPPPPPPPPPQHTPIDDRRHHEPERYPPMQEHRHQPPHSPAHPQFASYPRDPMVKAEDDPLPQLRRPHSTGNTSDTMTPGTPHSGLPPQNYVDDKRHLNYENGPQPPIYHRQPSYPPQTPLSHNQPYDYQPAYGPPHGELTYPIQIASSSQKRKAQRASQACDMCRQLKAKCDELKPCKSCKEKKVDCKYREAVPKQQDKVAADILDTLLYLKDEFSSFNQRISKMEHQMKRLAPPDGTQPEPMEEDDDRPVSVDSAAPNGEEGYSSSPTETMAGTQAPIGTVEARTITRNMEEETEAEPGPYVRPGAPAIPLNHTTLAALLLKWPSVKSLVQRYLDAENVKFVDEFPIRQEERRGLLRVWGRGEGLDSSRSDKDAMHDLGMMEVQDEYSDSGAPSPADCWGGISGSPGPVEGKGAYIASVQGLDFTDTVVWKYVKSYQDNIQNLHPLIIPVELNAMVRLFLDGIQQSINKQSKTSGIAKFVLPATPMGAPHVEPGVKRKRSPAPDGIETPIPAMKAGKPTFQRSINNALVLLVLALGKICLVKDKKIPDVVPVSEPLHGSPQVKNGHPASPTQNSPPSYGSHSHSAGLPSPKDNAERSGSGSSRRASFQGGGPPSVKTAPSLKRNCDVIPGLDYFAYATDILGGQLAGTSLRHIHAHILAGLYHGQLGRVMESYAYIKEAGWALQIKMRPSLDRFKKLQENMPFQLNAVTEKSDNQLIFAFWTCLQLESDIIAELPLPQSHILAFEEIMPYPNLTLAIQLGFDEHVLQSYLAQLYLRKSLNQIHQMLYNPENSRPLHSEDGLPTENVIKYIKESLDMRFVPPEFMFDHSDPPAPDLLSARLRAKYWGAQVITYRPFIRRILEHNHKAMWAESPASISGVANTNGDGTPGEFPQDVIDHAVKGIRGLIESTRAFHRVEDKRFVITNVFGTAHAQWGNLLTLAAVYKDPTLKTYVDELTLKELFSRTISFFKIIAHPSSALAIDMRILEGLERELFRKPGVDTMDTHMGSSFSSTTSNGTPMPPITSIPPPGMHMPGTHTPGTDNMMPLPPIQPYLHPQQHAQQLPPQLSPQQHQQQHQQLHPQLHVQQHPQQHLQLQPNTQPMS
ncbi:hypothetical protein B0T22DRAFT_240664 [Podospora appendiculata]|uniref:Zn(2)-C6 fungal-type domain-containing protein n=1 Tax=Podospora appendiculata TaxID=314037 RepID=A0AAE1CB06_9PEZI|nr:hypothetical protein B0T22DRAFT_240664 [Podospora appendiculata]